MTKIYNYRGYAIMPRRERRKWCVAVHPTRPDLPILSCSTLSMLAAREEEAVGKVKQSIDSMLSNLNDA